MATRGLYKFYSTDEELKNNKPTAVIYRHWDNYLQGGGQDLQDFVEHLAKAKFDSRFGDVSYFSAKFVVFLANQFNETDRYEETKGDFDSLNFLSVGIVPNGVDCGEEYIYHIVCNGQGKIIGKDYKGLPTITIEDIYRDTVKDLYQALHDEPTMEELMEKMGG